MTTQRPIAHEHDANYTDVPITNASPRLRLHKSLRYVFMPRTDLRELRHHFPRYHYDTEIIPLQCGGTTLRRKRSAILKNGTQE